MKNQFQIVKTITLLILFVIAFYVESYAHFGSKGPFGGSVSCGTTNGSVVFLGTSNGGVYESTNSSLVAWRARPVGLKSGKITALTHTSSYLVAGTADSGVFIFNGYVGTDRYWVKINNGLTNLKIRSLISIDTITFLAGTEGGGVFKTSNKGASWTSVSNATLSNDVITSFAKAGNRIFLASEEAGVFVSDDNGVTWSDFNDGNTLNITNTNRLSYNATTDQLMVLNENGLWIAASAGAVSSPGYSLANTGLTSATINEISNNGLAWLAATDAGVYASPTNTIGWLAANVGLSGNALNVTAIIPFQTNLVIGTASEGIFKSNATTVSWVANNTNFNNLKAYTMICKDSALVIAATEKGLFVSKDLAANYTSANSGLTDSLHITDLVFSGTNLFASTMNDGIFVSTDTGSTWTSYNLGLSNLDIRKLAVSTLYLYAICSNGTIYQSSALGWVAIQNGLPSGVNPTSFAFYDGNIYLGTLGDGVYKRPEGSGTWASVNTGLSDLNITSITTNGNKLFLGSNGSGVFVSELSSIQWSTTSPLAISHTALIGLDATKVQAMSYYEGYIYASYKGGLVATSDNGLTWIPGGNQFNLPSFTDVNKISFVTTRVFVTTENNGLYSNSLTELPPITTSIFESKDLNTVELSVSPNPNSGQFKIMMDPKMAGKETEMIIYNAQGMVMGSFKEPSSEFSVNYPKGLYYVQFTTAQGNITRKMIIE